MGREGLGEFEHLVLLAVARLGDDAYGVPIVDELEKQTGRHVSRASVYVALKRLENRHRTRWIATRVATCSRRHEQAGDNNIFHA